MVVIWQYITCDDMWKALGRAEIVSTQTSKGKSKGKSPNKNSNQVSTILDYCGATGILDFPKCHRTLMIFGS